jgi:hypothetical protein
LNKQAYFGEFVLNVDQENPLSKIVNDVSIPHHKDHIPPLKGSTIEVFMDPKSSKKLINIGNFLSLEEVEDHFDLLHSHLCIFF